jgi:uncharacterized protein YbgA (DUF1722 family)/uncharacterized protein YbbK (DUF523 family)
MPRLLRVGVSACLLGHEVRWDGGHKRDRFVTDTLGPWVEWVSVCPELELGLGVPREPIHLEGDPAAPRLVAPKTGTDHTAAMLRFARTRVEQLVAQDLSGYVLKKDSPSCGMERVRVHRSRGGAPARTGVGFFARVLRERLPLLPVEEEGRLNHPALRENFVERIFAYERWKRLAARPSRAALVAFHTAHKLLLLAHDPAAYRRLGRLVARMKGRRPADVAAAYGAAFMGALAVPATRGRHANVLEHMLGYVSDHLTSEERRELVELIAGHRRGLVPLVGPLTLLKHHVRRLDVAYLAGQVYLDPYPKELMVSAGPGSSRPSRAARARTR